ncbi:MAG: chorismate synthase, partial [Chlamydiales bacterium]|nr:chorismate synthase [Chlamydiales bacterium]
MASNRFGNLFQITTWGESHGKAIGVVIDGCPAGLPLCNEEINQELQLRLPGRTPYVSPRKEKDLAEIYSGLFEGKTTGAPISILIHNQDASSSKYEPIKDLLRPGHANFTYLEKYGIFDYRGGGRASARETACRVAAGAIAKKLLRYHQIEVIAFIQEIGGIATPPLPFTDPQTLLEATRKSPLFCPDEKTTAQITQAIEKAKEEGDSLGGIIRCIAFNLPVGLGDPVYEKLEANLAKAILSIPATKGFEIGSGFQAARMKGSEHNDPFTLTPSGKVATATNFAGGTLGGISTGMPLTIQIPFKPTSSIAKPQKTLNTQKEESPFTLPEGSRHDPCVAIRAVPIVEAMTALVLIDALLMDRASSRL